jgi:hypothetical protein
MLYAITVAGAVLEFNQLPCLWLRANKHLTKLFSALVLIDKKRAQSISWAVSSQSKRAVFGLFFTLRNPSEYNDQRFRCLQMNKPIHCCRLNGNVGEP